ncbi:MAG: M20 family metallo-hydrolase [Bacteroidales bacterium]|jgi:succinyl-diaminopimelate desuccinylase|nr:M20 family metallo-hydrolase [Bacteroidales bacterium]
MEKLFTAISRLRNYVLELQQNMTRLRAVSPANGGRGEWQKAQYLESELKKFHFDEYFHADASCPDADGGVRPNIVAKRYGLDRSRTLWLMAHIDVVPEGDLALWNTPPFEVTLDADGDTIYGRGVEDNQQAIAAALTVLHAIEETDTQIPVNLGIILLSDEETGNKYGLRHLLETCPDMFGPHDDFIVQDSGNADGSEIEIAEKNLFWLKFTVTGQQCHGAHPFDGINAFYAGSHLAIQLRDRLYARFDARDELFDPPVSTFEPTKKEANVPNINTVPGIDVFYMDSRVLSQYTEQMFIGEVGAITREIEIKYGVQVNYEFVNRNTSQATPKDAPLVRKYAEAVKAVNGVDAKIIGIGGGTFAADIRNLGHHAVVGSKIYCNPHQPNEKSSLQFTLADAKVIAWILMH